MDETKVEPGRGGDQLIFLPSEGRSALGNEVYRWDHETGRRYKVADDFGELESI